MMNERLREIRIQRGTSKISLAAKAGVSPGTISFAELHGYVPSESIQRRIAAALEVSPNEIWPRDEVAVA